MLKSKRKIFRQGNGTVITLPAALVKGDYTTLAANRVVLMDATGRIAEGDLLRFLEDEVEPRLWKWLKDKER